MVCRVVCTLSLVTELSASCTSLMQNVSVTRANGKYTGDQLRRHVVRRNATTLQSSDDQSPIRQAVIRCPTRAVIGKMKEERSHRGKFAGGSRGRDGGRYVGGTRGRLTSRRLKRTAVTQLNRGDLLHAFNQMRRTVSPLASNMLFMVTNLFTTIQLRCTFCRRDVCRILTEKFKIVTDQAKSGRPVLKIT